MSDLIDDLERRYGPGPLIVEIRQDVKRGGELMATYEMEYASWSEPMLAIAADLREGRVEAITIAGKPVAAEDLAALWISRPIWPEARPRDPHWRSACRFDRTPSSSAGCSQPKTLRPPYSAERRRSSATYSSSVGPVAPRSSRRLS